MSACGGDGPGVEAGTHTRCRRGSRRSGENAVEAVNVLVFGFCSYRGWRHRHWLEL